MVLNSVVGSVLVFYFLVLVIFCKNELVMMFRNGTEKMGMRQIAT